MAFGVMHRHGQRVHGTADPHWTLRMLIEICVLECPTQIPESILKFDQTRKENMHEDPFIQVSKMTMKAINTQDPSRDTHTHKIL